MPQKLTAIYLRGAFVPKFIVDLPEDTEVELAIEGFYLLPPEVTKPQKREHLLKTIVERMQQNPFPANSPRLTREQLYQRS